VLNTLRNALTRSRHPQAGRVRVLRVRRVRVHDPRPAAQREPGGVELKLIQSGAFYQFLGFLSGGALQHLSIIAMGITPYINASIIMQLMTVVIPQLEEMAKKGGEEGRKTISRYTRWLTIVLATSKRRRCRSR
jgi:preprotein translocase subunit SecY